MSDPQDRRMADLFEAELRSKAELDPGNVWELIWFLRLPLETRCNYMRILEARINQDSTRRFLFRQSCYHQRSWRSPTRECMFVQAEEPSRPFASLSKRQRRKPIEYGQSRTRKPRDPVPKAAVPASAAPPAPSAASKRTHATPRRPNAKSKTPVVLPPRDDPPDPDAAPPRPPTPDSLRASLCEDRALHAQALGYDPSTFDSQAFSPRALVTPPEPVKYDPFPLLTPGKPFLIGNQRIWWTLSYMVAAGHHHAAPWHNYTVRQAAEDLYHLETHAPGVLDQLTATLFPSGIGDLAAAANLGFALDIILDFVRGWSIIPQAWLSGKMPNPIYSLCACGNIRAVQ